MIRVFVGHRSSLSRATLLDAVRRAYECECVGEAGSSDEVARALPPARPQLIVLGMALAADDDFSLVKRIMNDLPTPMVLLAAPSEMDSSRTALALGAVAVLPMLPMTNSPDFPAKAMEFTQALVALAGIKVVRRRFGPDGGRTAFLGTPVVPAGDRANAPPAQPGNALISRGEAIPPRRDPSAREPWGGYQNDNLPERVIALAASTGGPVVLEQVFGALPTQFPLPILVVQHIAREFTDGFVTWLNHSSGPRVKIAEHGEPLLGGTIYVAPEDYHLGVMAGHRAALSDEPALGGFRPAASWLFHAIADIYRQHALAVIFTGMGRDGVDGLRAIQRAGGRILAQDEQSSVVFGMPGAAVAAGVVDLVLPVPAIIEEMFLHAGARPQKV